MDENIILDWLFSDLDELIDFDGYRDMQEVKKREGREHIEISDKYGGSSTDNH
ncbi:MAG: hypothetical protein HPY74_17545 [Firmicutes bacterium]|jgi:hypothetical protein|nr:hypothetical protein [Clostridia bacterium]NSW92438.1 hypothetical protein [Bacillota bacterium]